MPQYYVKNSHSAIIESDEFDAVQIEMERRKNLGLPIACQSPLSTKLVCGESGGFYGSKVWSPNNKYRKTIWQCDEKYKGETRCSTPHVTEAEVKEKFLDAFYSILSYSDELIANRRLAQQVLCSCSGFDEELEELYREIEVVTELSRKAILENANNPIYQQEWHERNSEYLRRHRIASERLNELENLKKHKLSKHHILEKFIKTIDQVGVMPDSFDERLWAAVVERVTVMKEGRLEFQFKDGNSILV